MTLLITGMHKYAIAERSVYDAG